MSKAALFATCLLLLASLTGPATAADPARAEALRGLAADDTDARRRAVIELAQVGEMADAQPLVARLRDGDALVRTLAERALWAIWERSGDGETDRVYRQGVTEMQRGAYAAAVETFTRVIARRPQFAEGWNKRATVYFLMGDYRHSLADCDEVMRRNPLHFGALAGYGQIYLRLDRQEESLSHFRRALAINPNLDGVRQAVDALEDAIAERRRRMI